jgi:hypothetical protein
MFPALVFVILGLSPDEPPPQAKGLGVGAPPGHTRGGQSHTRGGQSATRGTGSKRQRDDCDASGDDMPEEPEEQPHPSTDSLKKMFQKMKFFLVSNDDGSRTELVYTPRVNTDDTDDTDGDNIEVPKLPNIKGWPMFIVAGGDLVCTELPKSGSYKIESRYTAEDEDVWKLRFRLLLFDDLQKILQRPNAAGLMKELLDSNYSDGYNWCHKDSRNWNDFQGLSLTTKEVLEWMAGKLPLWRYDYLPEDPHARDEDGRSMVKNKTFYLHVTTMDKPDSVDENGNGVCEHTYAGVSAKEAKKNTFLTSYSKGTLGNALFPDGAGALIPIAFPRRGKVTIYYAAECTVCLTPFSDQGTDRAPMQFECMHQTVCKTCTEDATFQSCKKCPLCDSPKKGLSQVEAPRDVIVID